MQSRGTTRRASQRAFPSRNGDWRHAKGTSSQGTSPRALGSSSRSNYVTGCAPCSGWVLPLVALFGLPGWFCKTPASRQRYEGSPTIWRCACAAVAPAMGHDGGQEATSALHSLESAPALAYCDWRLSPSRRFGRERMAAVDGVYFVLDSTVRFSRKLHETRWIGGWEIHLGTPTKGQEGRIMSPSGLSRLQSGSSMAWNNSGFDRAVDGLE